MAGEKIIYDKLAALDENTLLNEAALAGLLDVHPRTVKRMEENGHIPRHFKLGVNNCWIAGKVIDFFQERAREAQEKQESANEALSRHMP